MRACATRRCAGQVESREVGRTALALVSSYTTAVTGEVLYVDAGFHIEGMVFH